MLFAAWGPSDSIVQERVDAVEVASVLEGCPDAKVEVAGHTDSTGSASINLRVSEQRAQAVVEYLVRRGVAEERLTAVGYGEAEPVADNGTREGRARNRRVELHVTA